MTAPTEDLISRLEGEPGDCPFCGRDPYHYVDNGVGMERVAVTCCDEGIAYFQHGDPVLTEQISLRREAADALRDRTSEPEAGAVAIDPKDMMAIETWIDAGEPWDMTPRGHIKSLWQSVRRAHPAPATADKLRNGWMPASEAVVWQEYLIADGDNVAIAQLAEADYEGTFWACDEDAITWEPTVCQPWPLAALNEQPQ